MAINVTCPKCLTRFSVSEKFAGQEGPCPKCKNKIRVPDASQEVKVHEASTGPKDAKGRPVLRPIFRREQPITAIHWTIAGCLAFVMLALSLVARNMYSSELFPLWATAMGAVLASFPMSLLGYVLFRDRETGGFDGKDLWVRVAICAAIFSVLWIFSPLLAFAFNESVSAPNTLSQAIAISALMLIGGVASMLIFEFDYLIGLVHAGVYVLPCIVMRLLAGLSAIPGLESYASPVAPNSIEGFQQITTQVLQIVWL